MKTLIKNVTILTMDDADRVLHDGWLLIDGEKIAALGEEEQKQAETALDDRTVASAQTNAAAQPIENLQQAEAVADEVIDGAGGILLPGFVNTHCHVSMVPFRSMGDDCPDRLRRFLFPLELEAMTPELVYWGALYGIAEMFLSGTTTFLDMYYFEDRVAEACGGQEPVTTDEPDAAPDFEGMRAGRHPRLPR